MESIKKKKNHSTPPGGQVCIDFPCVLVNVCIPPVCVCFSGPGVRCGGTSYIIDLSLAFCTCCPSWRWCPRGLGAGGGRL